MTLQGSPTTNRCPDGWAPDRVFRPRPHRKSTSSNFPRTSERNSPASAPAYRTYAMVSNPRLLLSFSYDTDFLWRDLIWKDFLKWRVFCFPFLSFPFLSITLECTYEVRSRTRQFFLHSVSVCDWFLHLSRSLLYLVADIERRFCSPASDFYVCPYRMYEFPCRSLFTRLDVYRDLSKKPSFY